MKCPTKKELNAESCKFLKKLYWDLFLDCIKKKDYKSLGQLRKGWEKIIKEHK